VPTAPSLVGLLLFALVVAVGIYRHEPPLPQTAVWGLFPWIVAGSSLRILASVVQYPPYLRPLFATPWAYLTTIVIAGLVWLSILVFATSRREVSTAHYYIGTMGTGATVAVWIALVPHLGELSLSRILVYLVLLSVTFLASIGITISVGLWSVNVVQYAVITGGFVIFGALVRGTATVANIVINGPAAHTTVSAEVHDVAATILQYGWVNLDGTFLWTWLLLIAYVGVAILIASRVAPYASTRPRAVHTVLGIVGGVGVVTGFNDFVLVVVG